MKTQIKDVIHSSVETDRMWKNDEKLKLLFENYKKFSTFSHILWKTLAGFPQFPQITTTKSYPHFSISDFALSLQFRGEIP